jgi:tRNA(Ile)-lysidine synthase TilS/MesJ
MLSVTLAGGFLPGWLAADGSVIAIKPLRERVVVGRDGGLEAAARNARYTAIEERVTQEGGINPQILTGHTMDDQAETVLLALARGSGARALSGIPVRRGRIIRPFLSLRRKDTVTACEQQGLTPWMDPTNDLVDGPRRSALRVRVMPELVDVLGPGVVVEQGARVEDCVLFADVVVEAGARLATTVADDGSRFGRGCEVSRRNCAQPPLLFEPLLTPKPPRWTDVPDLVLTFAPFGIV